MVEGAPHTAKRSMINLYVYGVSPCPVYKGVEEGEGRPPMERPKGGFLLLLGVGFPPFLVQLGEKGRRGRREGKGAGPLPIRIGLGGAPTLAASSSLPLRPNKAHILSGWFR